MMSADVVKGMIGRAKKAALASKDRENGAPHASLVQMAACGDGRPIILVSGLAVHTRNLLADPQASLLIDETDAAGDPVAGARVSLSGSFSADVPTDGRGRYLAQHPGAAQFVDFGDFQFLVLNIVSAHLIQGFGRIVTLPGREVWSGVAGSS